MREQSARARLATGLFRVRSFAGLGLPDSVLAAAEAVRDAAPDPAMLSGVTGGLEPVDLAVPGWVFYQTAVELAAHGFPDASRIAAERTVEWYRQSPLQSSTAGTYMLARALELTGRYSEALELLEGLARDHPESVDFQGLIGIVAARSGDEQTALRIDRWLAARTNVFPPGLPTLHRAGIAAVRGDTVVAMQLILSLPQGAHPHDFLQFHVDPAFTSLREDPAFRRFLVPRG